MLNRAKALAAFHQSLCGHNLRTLFARFKIIKRRSIDDIITRGATAIGVLLGIIAVVMFIVFMWEVARSAYFAAAAKWYGWSKEEKFEREMAREERRWAREERNAKIDGIVAGDVVRRRHGVNIATFAIAGLAFQLNLPWWHAGGITVAALVGLTMAAGLSFRW